MKHYTPREAAEELRNSLIEIFLVNGNSCGVMSEDDIIIGGSVALGTYSSLIGTDIDIFIKCQKPGRVIDRVRQNYPYGMEKQGPLHIWWIKNYREYEADIVALDRGDISIQTLQHTEYYTKIITPEMRDMVIWLKEFFYISNCYGAEVGGITGICCTRMAEMWGRLALVKLEEMFFSTGDVFIEDPVKEGRNLFASVLPHKRKKLIEHVQKYNRTGSVAYTRDVANMMKSFDNVYRITLRPRLGKDREYQCIGKIIDRSFKQLKQQIAKWEPEFDYDIMIIGNDAYVGVTTKTVVPLTKTVDKEVPLKYLSEKDFESMKEKGTKYSINTTLDYCIIHTPPPIINSNKRFEELLFERLEKEYIDYELIEE